jgi:hypothetical protein
MDMPDKLEQNISETIQLQDLPGHVLVSLTANVNILTVNSILIYLLDPYFCAFGLP